MAIKVAFLGPEGTFCEEASIAYAKKIKHAELIPYSTIHDVLYEVDRGNVDEGIVPIENSVEGTVGVVTDMLVKEVNLKIKQEIILPVHHYLLAKKKVSLKTVTDIVSHPQAIAQCQKFTRKNIPKAQVHLAYSTASAVREVALSIEGETIPSRIGARKRPVFAAIGTLAASRLYNLKVLATKINDYKSTLTRFVVLAKHDHAATKNDKTSVVFSIYRDRPGGLYDVLGEFATRKINLTKIESRPSKKVLGDYFFFIDMEGHHKDRTVAQALQAVKNKASFLKILGSYPRTKGK